MYTQYDISIDNRCTEDMTKSDIIDGECDFYSPENEMSDREMDVYL